MRMRTYVEGQRVRVGKGTGVYVAKCERRSLLASLTSYVKIGNSVMEVLDYTIRPDYDSDPNHTKHGL